jgi:phosphoketolase
MKLTGITSEVLKQKFIITDEECAIILPIIKDGYRIEELANLMASKYDSLNDFLEDGDYEKIFSGALNKLENIAYVTSYIIATSDESIKMIKEILSTKNK